MKLKVDYPKLYELLNINPQSFLDIERADIIPRNTLIVEYFITDNATYIFLTDNYNLIVKSVSIKKNEINALVTLYRDLIEKNKSVPANGWKPNESEQYRNTTLPLKNISVLLYSYLIEPIQNEIRDNKTVAVIPFGSLHYVPFHALAKEKKDGGLEFLIEEKELVYLVSTSANYLRSVFRNGKNGKIRGITAFGNPDLGEPDLSLPYSEEEVMAIKQIFPYAAVFLKENATKAKFKSSWGKTEIVHLAAHGVLKPQPTILLSPLGEGNLRLSDITELPPADNTRLVVLSACEAGIDDNGGNPSGQELNSIAFAFTMAGAPSVIASLWRVSDRAAYELMLSFYKNLKKEEKLDYNALRMAQIEMLNRKDRYSQPFYWAPFIMVGEWE